MALVQQESSQLASVQQQTAALNAHIKQLEDVLSEEQREKEAAAALALADQKRIQVRRFMTAVCNNRLLSG